MGRLPGSLGNGSCVKEWIKPSAKGYRNTLLDYCGQDTLALLRLHEVLRLNTR